MTYYDILGVPYTATQAEIKRAYIAQIKFFHPDVFTDFPEIAKEKSAQLNEAYSVLSSPEKRAEYDRSVFGSSSNSRYASYNNADSQSNDTGCHSDNTPPPHHEETTSSKSTHENSASPPPNQAHQNSSERDKEKFFYTVKIVLIELFIIAAVLFLILYIPNGISCVSSLLSTEVTEPLPSPQVPPENGKPMNSVFYRHDAPLTVKTRGDGYYFVKLKDAYSHRDVCSFFIYGGRSAYIDVDYGCYNLYYAHGDTWYGEEFLFGPDTQYYKADGELLFESDSNYVYGWTVELYLQEGGNLGISAIDESAF